ncbi:flagellar basal body L-ring protein FlgH [Vogesella sp. LIG4]|uniref:flagellar basal body L-ring protein FlgH n=1 Tax=Vogesella sp. LIG4 TaxID=1192162 RepID=UPI00081F8A6C|nr:flagellar basal body L-ring protein FlgH [Vogesella sp. LIG4]SCK30311.1 flagellar L-ring protein precursor FlgH [Vogesella sp. LIG4]
MKKLLPMLIVTVLLTACSTQSQPITQQPMSLRPQPPAMPVPSQGAIFQAGSFQPFFEDKVPLRVGDILTVTISENTTSSNKEDSTGSRSSNVNGSIGAGLSLPFVPGALEKKLAGTSLSGSGSGSESGKTSNTTSNQFQATITVTVIDVYPNGNLLVSGEKQIKINSEHEFVRLSGVVNPRDIKQDRTIDSTRLADARVEELNQGRNRLYNDTGWLQKIFLSVMPF